MDKEIGNKVFISMIEHMMKQIRDGFLFPCGLKDFEIVDLYEAKEA